MNTMMTPQNITIKKVTLSDIKDGETIYQGKIYGPKKQLLRDADYEKKECEIINLPMFGPCETEQDQINQDMVKWEVERNWKRSVKDRSPVEWLHVFPEAKARWGKTIAAELKIKSIQIHHVRGLNTWETRFRLRLHYAGILLDDPDMIAYRGKEIDQRLHKELQAIEGRLAFYKMIGKNPGNHITDEMIERAKKYPLERLLTITRAGFAQCFVHTDTKPSMYCKKGFAYCFVCHRSFDTIAILRERDHMSFKDAVLMLQNA